MTDAAHREFHGIRGMMLVVSHEVLPEGIRLTLQPQGKHGPFTAHEFRVVCVPGSKLPIVGETISWMTNFDQAPAARE